MKARKPSGKYAKELERLRDLNAINEVLKKSDIENAALTNTSKDSEVVSDNVIDTMLDQLNLNKNASKDLEIVENLASRQSRDGSTISGTRHIMLSKTRKGVTIKRKVHVKKVKGKGRQAKPKRKKR